MVEHDMGRLLKQGWVRLVTHIPVQHHLAIKNHHEDNYDDDVKGDDYNEEPVEDGVVVQEG